jgi:exonuclease SbcD
MKILHTADWHLGKKLEQFSRLPEQIEVMQEIVDIANEEKVDAVIIAGDLYDNFNPSNEAVELFYKTLKQLTNNGKRLVVAIAGNHDSPERIEAPDPLARTNGIILTGYPHTHVPLFELETGIRIIKSAKGFIEVNLPNIGYPLRLLLTPYVNEYRLKAFLGTTNKEEKLREVLSNHWEENANKYCDEKGVNVLMTHLFMVKQGEVLPEEPDDEKPILNVGGAQVVYTNNIPKQIQYTALGHLHRPHQMDDQPCSVVYSGSPISYSFSEANQQKYVSIVELFPGKKVSQKRIELVKGKKLLRKKFSQIAEAILWLQENPAVLVELTIQTETYLKAEERKSLFNAHKGIVTLIPELIGDKALESKSRKIDLTQNMDDLFKQYFTSKKAIEPNEEIMSLFNELKTTEKE